MSEHDLRDDFLIYPANRPPRADAVRNREKLLTTARELFDAQGAEAVTMSSVAEKAGVGKGTLYRHFRDKADLCHALLDDAMRRFQEQTLSRIGAGDEPLVTLRWFLAEGARYVVAHRDLLLEIAGTPGEMMQHPAHSWWHQTLLALLTRARLDGDRDYMADALYMLLDVRVIHFQQEVRGYSLERVIAGLHMMLDGFAAYSTTTP